MERRRGKRRETLLLTKLKTPDGQHAAGLIYNLGQNGMFVLTKSTLNLGQNVYIRVPVHRATLWLAAQVVHRSPYGAGLTFGELSGVARALTQALP